MIVIWLRYEWLKSDKRFENCPKWAKIGLSMWVKSSIRGKDLFQARSSIKFGESLVTVFLLIPQMPYSSSLILEQVLNISWYKLEFNMFLTFSYSLKQREQLTPNKKRVLSSLQVSSVAFLICGSSLAMISFFAHFGQFSEHLSDFNHSYLSQMTI